MAAQAQPTSEQHSAFYLLVFPPIPASGEIDTQNFLNIIGNLDNLFKIMGSWLKLVKADVNGNIKKITNSYNKDPATRKYINTLVQSEIDANVHNKDPSGSIGLMWLSRGVRFFYEFLVAILDDYHNNVTNESLTDTARKAYDVALLKHHNWLMQKSFHMISLACPKRSTIINNVTQNGIIPVELIMKELDVFMSTIKPTLDRIDMILTEKGIIKSWCNFIIVNIFW